MITKHWSSTLETDLDWIEEEFLSLSLGDKRLNKRLRACPKTIYSSS
ncbi:transposase DNA-binding-containing protein [Leptospira sp. WS92.C1]